MTNVYFTWFGSPSLANKTINGLSGLQRPDLAAIRLASRARHRAGTHPEFKFCCMRKYADRFRNYLPSHIEVVPIEEQFTSRVYHSISMSQPNLDDLDMSVDFILRETLTFQGGRLLVHRLAFLKDLWSLYCMWRFGGYHLDTGCFQGNGPDLNFPDPTTFGVVADTTGGKTLYHDKVQFPSGEMCSTLSSGLNVFRGVVLEGMLAPKGRSKLDRTIDVWLLRSPAGHKAAKLSLEFYLKGWFVMRSKHLPDSLEAQALRELVISAIATGVTHSGHGEGCFGENLYKTHLIDMVNGYLPSLNIRKVGFQSHVV